MLQELNLELQRELGSGLFSHIKNYKQFNFEDNVIIVEYMQHLWFSAKLIMVYQFHIHKNTALYSIKESPNFQVFLKQIEAFKISEDENSINISFLLNLKLEKSLKKETFAQEIQQLIDERPHELKHIILSSMNRYQKHYFTIINSMPFDDKINDVFQSDQAFIFIEKGFLEVHHQEQLPHKQVDKKVYLKQSQNKERIQLDEMSDKIFFQLKYQSNKKVGVFVDSIVNSIQTYKYFTFYQQKFLLVHYTVFLKVLAEQYQNTRIYKIDENVIQQSALFSVNNGEHTLINIQEDDSQHYPQMVQLLGKQLVNIMDTSQFMKLFTETIIHQNVNPNIDILELSSKFKLGSILIYRSQFFTNQACVYLGSDLVITVKHDNNNKNQILELENIQNILSDEQMQMRNYMQLNEDEEEYKRTDETPNQIFQFSRFDEFIQQQRTIQEIRFKFQPYDKQELFDKAILMNESQYKFNIYKQNSEHLAFELASGFRFSPQQNLFINKIGEVFQNLFYKK